MTIGRDQAPPLSIQVMVMPRKKKSEPQTDSEGLVPGTAESQEPVNPLFRKSKVTVLPDGRVRAAITGLREANDEVSYKCSQARAAKFMLNDIAPDIE